MFYGIKIDYTYRGYHSEKWYTLPNGQMFFTEYLEVANAMLDNARTEETAGTIYPYDSKLSIFVQELRSEQPHV